MEEIKKKEQDSSLLLKEHQDDLDRFRKQMQVQNEQSNKKATEVLDEHLSYYTD